MLDDFGRLIQLHSSESVANGISHPEQNQTAMSYGSQLLTKQRQIHVWQLLYL